MKIKVTCPCGCGHEFEVEVPKQKRTMSDEERARRADLMRKIRAEKGGKPEGAKDTKPRKERSDKGVSRPSMLKVVETRIDRFVKLCNSFETDTKLCPLSMENGGPCDGVVIEDDGSFKECTSMITCYFKYRKHELYGNAAKDEGEP